jgi:hypothetical protein
MRRHKSISDIIVVRIFEVAEVTVFWDVTPLMDSY